MCLSLTAGDGHVLHTFWTSTFLIGQEPWNKRFRALDSLRNGLLKTFVSFNSWIEIHVRSRVCSLCFLELQNFQTTFGSVTAVWIGPGSSCVEIACSQLCVLVFLRP